MALPKRIPIKIVCGGTPTTTTNHAPAPPLDEITGVAPAFWCGEPVEIAVGVFAADGETPDLDTATGITVTIVPSQGGGTALLTKTDSSLGSIADLAAWDARTAEHFSASCTASDMAIPMLMPGETSRQCWMVVTATDGADTFILAAGPCMVFATGL